MTRDHTELLAAIAYLRSVCRDAVRVLRAMAPHSGMTAKLDDAIAATSKYEEPTR